jgi:hypothetical protein
MSPNHPSGSESTPSHTLALPALENSHIDPYTAPAAKKSKATTCSPSKPQHTLKMASPAPVTIVWICVSTSCMGLDRAFSTGQTQTDSNTVQANCKTHNSEKTDRCVEESCGRTKTPASEWYELPQILQ